MNTVSAHAERVKRAIVEQSSTEIVRALGLEKHVRLKPYASRLFAFSSERVGETLGQFDDELPQGFIAALSAALPRFGVSVHSTGAPVPNVGPVVVLSNHPGAFDTLSTSYAIQRDDLRVLAAERAFLRALPNFAEKHLLLLPDEPSARAGALFAERTRLSNACILQYPMGEIEPDPVFDREATVQWPASTVRLLKYFRRLNPAFQLVVSIAGGVHSSRAKKFIVTQWLEKKGVTTFAPLLQTTVPYFRAVNARMHFSVAIRLDALLSEPEDVVLRIVHDLAEKGLREVRS